jgi:glycine oxidase
LRERTGIDNGYVRCGGIEILDADEAEVVELWRAEGLRAVFLGEPGPQGPWVQTGHDETPADLAVGVHQQPHTSAYLLPDFAQVRNPWHLRALIAACERLGVTLRPNTPFHLADFRPDRRYLLAAGAWSGSLLPSLPVVPVRGQIVLFRCDRPPFTHIVMHGKRYLVPRPDGRVLVGSTEEPEAGFEKANTPEGVEELKQFAFDLCPALRSAEVEKTWAGLRPGSPDGLPFIGPVPGLRNVFAAVGHFRAGVQLSIGTAMMVREMLTGEPSGIPFHPFRLDRPPDVTTRPAFRS